MDFFVWEKKKTMEEEGLSAGVCARSNGRLLSEAQPATCNATKQVHTDGDRRRKRKAKKKKK